MNKQDIIHYAINMADRLKGTPDFDYDLFEEPSNTNIIRVSSTDYPATVAEYDLDRNKVIAASGSRTGCNGALNECLNNDVLVRNATYHIDGSIYVKSDSQGRPWHWRVFYNRSHRPVIHGARPKRELKRAKDGDQAGHVLAVALGGGHERINIVPMPWNINEQWYRFQEIFLASCLQAMDDEDDWYIELDIVIDYCSVSLRPEAINLEADIDNGRGYTARLKTELFY